MHKLIIDQELRHILFQIKNENKTLEEWAEIESSDMFQSENYCGGFDATENAFTFSYFAKDSVEYWFQFSLDELEAIHHLKISEIDLSLAVK